MRKSTSLLHLLLCGMGRHKPDRKQRYLETGSEFAPCRHCNRPLRHWGPHDWRPQRTNNNRHI